MINYPEAVKLERSDKTWNMSFMNKVKAGLGEVGNQAKGLARSVGEGSKQVASGFKLENEVSITSSMKTDEPMSKKNGIRSIL
jgi:hypothetical protein